MRSTAAVQAESLALSLRLNLPRGTSFLQDQHAAAPLDGQPQPRLAGARRHASRCAPAPAWPSRPRSWRRSTPGPGRATGQRRCGCRKARYPLRSEGIPCLPALRPLRPGVTARVRESPAATVLIGGPLHLCASLHQLDPGEHAAPAWPRGHPAGSLRGWLWVRIQLSGPADME
jgi:hypothetical protein